MGKVTVNGLEVEIGDQERLNLIQVAKRADVEIPHYCWHPELTVVASCRMCLVETGDKKPDGSIAMQPKLLPACQTPAKDGTVVVTNSPKVKAAQAGTLEYLLLNHPLDCPICDQAGECYLQDYSYKYGNAESRLQEPKVQKIDKHYIGENITLFTDRCVMCSRCVRFTREFSGTAELQIINRGNHSEIDIFPGHPCNNKLAGNVVDICPVGALCSKDFLYQQRVWWLRTAKSVCTGCSTGCSIHVDQNEDHVYRLRPRVNPQSQGHFMCDEGRFGYKYVNDEARLKAPARRVSMNGNGKPAPAMAQLWEDFMPVLRAELVRAAERGPLLAILSPMMTCEEGYLLSTYLKKLAPTTTLALGPVPVVGEDDTYPKDVKGRPVEPVRFTIRAEKVPNRKGLEAILTHFEGKVLSFEAALAKAEKGDFAAVYVVGGYGGPWITETQAGTLRKASLLVVQDILPSPASELADFVIAAGAFSEKEGTLVNYAGLAQGIQKSTRAPGEARPDGRVFMELLERPGLFNAKALRTELAAAIDYFAPLKVGDLGEFGVFLEKQPAAANTVSR